MSEISSTQELRNLSLTLYAFHLRTDISKGVEQAASNASQLWEQLMGLGNTLKIPELQSLHQKLICYQSAQYQPSAEDQLAPGQQSLLSEYDLDLISSATGKTFPEKGNWLIVIAKNDQDALHCRIFNAQGDKAVDLQEAALGDDKSKQLKNLKTLLQPYWDSNASLISLENKEKIIAAVTSITGYTREESIEFPLVVQADSAGLVLSGSLAPFRIHDTYAIDLTLFSPNPITLGQLHQLNPQGLLLPPHIQASLGQTLLLYAEVDALQKEDRAIADACVAQLLHNQTMPEFLAEGKLLGSSIFEYESLATEPSQQRHILVWLNHNQLAPEVDEVSERLLYLTLCRHKILYVYDQSRWCDRQAKQIYSDLDQKIVQNFSQIAQAHDHLQQFQALLQEQLPQMAFEYDRHLRDLSDHTTTIQTNLENYQRQMAKLAKLPGNDLIFLQKFQNLAETKFLRQIQVDREYLAPGQAIFQQLIETIRGLAELEQTESDRRLERTIQVVGVGLGVGAIFGSSSAFIDRPWKSPFSPNADVHPFLSSLLVSLSAALLAGFATWWLTRPKKRLL